MILQKMHLERNCDLGDCSPALGELLDVTDIVSSDLVSKARVDHSSKGLEGLDSGHNSDLGVPSKGLGQLHQLI